MILLLQALFLIACAINMVVLIWRVRNRRIGSATFAIVAGIVLLSFLPFVQLYRFRDWESQISFWMAIVFISLPVNVAILSILIFTGRSRGIGLETDSSWPPNPTIGNSFRQETTEDVQEVE